MKRVLIFFMAFQLNELTAVVYANVCPPPEDVQPCYCISDQSNTRIDCIQVKSVEKVRNALSSLKNHRDLFVDFQKCSLGYIPSNLFQGLHVTKLSFTNCNLKAVGDTGRSALQGLEDIIEEFSIHFSFTEDHPLQFLNVSQLRSLYQLEIEGNAFKKLGDDWFCDGPSGLQNLFIMTNDIEELGDNAFSALINIKNLWVTGNLFKTIRRSMFPQPATYLISLDLTNNQIESLPSDIFSEMPSLKEVILSENAIQHIEETTWMPVWKQLTRVYLEDNPLNCDSGIEWMFKVARPYVVKARCSSPANKKDLDLKRLIDDELNDLLEETEFKIKSVYLK